MRRGGRARRAERRVERDAHRDAQRRERADAMATGAVSQGLSQGWALPLRTASAQRRPATLCCGSAPQQSVSMPSTPSTRDWASSLGRVLRQEASLQQLAPANGAQKDEGGLKAHSYTETASVCATPVASSQNGGTVLGDESLARELIKSTARPGGSALPPLRPTPPRLQNRRTVNLLIEKATEAGRSYCRSICLLIPRRCHTPDVIPQTSHPRRHIPDVIPPFDPDATTPFCPDVTPHVFSSHVSPDASSLPLNFRFDESRPSGRCRRAERCGCWDAEPPSRNDRADGTCGRFLVHVNLQRLLYTACISNSRSLGSYTTLELLPVTLISISI